MVEAELTTDLATELQIADDRRMYGNGFYTYIGGKKHRVPPWEVYVVLGSPDGTVGEYRWNRMPLEHDVHVAQETPMLHCELKKPVACWQYTPETTVLPMWALAWIRTDEKGKLEHHRPDATDDSEDVILENGDWLVLIDENNVLACGDEEFKKRFNLVAILDGRPTT